jgi:hypothetical protein
MALVATPALTYNSLRHIDEYEETPPFLETFGRLLHEFGLGDSVVLTRLHKHFELEEGAGEHVVLRLDVAANKIVSAVEPGMPVAKSVVPCTWKVSTNGSLAPVAFVELVGPAAPALASMHAAAIAALQHAPASEAIKAFVNAHALNNLVGVSLDLGSILNVPHGSLLFESTYDGRQQECCVVRSDEHDLASSIATNWSAVPSHEGGVIVLAKCVCNRGANVGHKHVRA